MLLDMLSVYDCSVIAGSAQLQNDAQIAVGGGHRELIGVLLVSFGYLENMHGVVASRSARDKSSVLRYNHPGDVYA